MTYDSTQELTTDIIKHNMAIRVGGHKELTVIY
jgi:hypothetical protein